MQVGGGCYALGDLLISGWLGRGSQVEVHEVKFNYCMCVCLVQVIKMCNL
jgi:hypothetical protein